MCKKLLRDSGSLNLSRKDREYLLELLGDYKFGYNMDELEVECPECGEVSIVSLNNADFL